MPSAKSVGRRVAVRWSRSRIHLRTSGLLARVLLAGLMLASPTPRLLGADSVAGTYKSEAVVLTLQGTSESLTGMIKVGGGVFPVTARQTGTDVAGTFRSQGHIFEFTASLAGDTLTLKSGENTYSLAREVVNPLDRAGSETPPNPLDKGNLPGTPAGNPGDAPPGPVASANTTPGPMTPGPTATVAPAGTGPQATTSPATTSPATTRPARRSKTAAGPPSRTQRVAVAIEKAKAFLYARQRDGNWEEVPVRLNTEDLASPQAGQWGGLTSLATYALLAADEKPTDPRLMKSLDFLRKADIVGTYALGLRAQVWQFLPQPLKAENRAAAVRDAQLLVNSCRTKGEALGFYHYLSTDEAYDHSASQYGVLGMWACQQAGVEVPGNYWKAVEDAWRRDQMKTGGWNYHPRIEDPKMRDGSVSMTSAGVATLFITNDYLHAADGIDCKGNVDNPNLTAGLKWMSEHFPQMNRQTDWFAYSLYGVSRIGVASGYKYFGTVDWFARGVDMLLEGQQDDGSFGTLYDTCFAMLFMVRGRAPVAINKLEYTIAAPRAEKKAGPWNQRPRDVAHLTRWLSHQVENDLNWQIVNLDVPVDELHDAPILFLSGNQALGFTREEEAKLRQYVEEGGMIIGNADCGGIGFAGSFRKLAGTLFPAYPMKEMPRDSVVFQYPYPRAKWKSQLSLQSVSNGARELMILIPSSDPARFWQSGATGGHEESFNFMADLYLWTSDRTNPRYKGESHVVRADQKIAPEKTIRVARLQYGGNWDPEPAGWRRLGAVLRNESHVALSVETVKLGQGKLSGIPVAHLTGTSIPKFNDAERKELKAYVDGGGTLVIDAAGGGTEFATAAEGELSAVFGADAAKIQPLAAGHAFFTAAGLTPEDIKYRAFARRSLGRFKGARLRGMEVKGRVAVFYSPEDLSVGLVGQTVDGIYGYEPQTATDLMSAILLYAAGK